MPRKQRYRLAGVPQLVRHRGHNGTPICVDEPDFEALCVSLADGAAEHDCALHAYAVLDTALYVLLTPAGEDGVARLMQDIGRRYVPWFNAAHGRRGTLWDGRYRACLVQPGGHVLSCYRYVESRPVAAGLAAAAPGYRWSSAAARAAARPAASTLDHDAYLALGRDSVSRRDAFERVAGAPLAASMIAVIEAALDASLVFGCDQYKDRLERELERRLRPGRPGRPRRALPGVAAAAGFAA